MKTLIVLVLLVTIGACSHRNNCHESSSCHKTGSCTKQDAKSVVTYDGHCPMGLTKKQKVKGDHQYKVEYKGKLYIFSSADARDTFMSKIDEHIKKADAHWEESMDAADRVR